MFWSGGFATATVTRRDCVRKWPIFEAGRVQIQIWPFRNFRSRTREFGNFADAEKIREASKVTTLLRIERRSREFAGALFSRCARTRLLMKFT